MVHQAAGRRGVMDHLEDVVLVEDVFTGARVGDEGVAAVPLERKRIGIQIELQRMGKGGEIDRHVLEPGTLK